MLSTPAYTKTLRVSFVFCYFLFLVYTWLEQACRKEYSPTLRWRTRLWDICTSFWRQVFVTACRQTIFYFARPPWPIERASLAFRARLSCCNTRGEVIHRHCLRLALVCRKNTPARDESEFEMKGVTARFQNSFREASDSRREVRVRPLFGTAVRRRNTFPSDAPA